MRATQISSSIMDILVLHIFKTLNLNELIIKKQRKNEGSRQLWQLTDITIRTDLGEKRYV
ncbi:unnamed protein product [Moneuplotes crassus]|uniref:Uncharacterized protein n=1 Tax=Euplotes crassus TaxID=5936 RepID=A0AAD1Y2E4_EUPCR|nr:unnamed protein product [Moneuplotes crassus]